MSKTFDYTDSLLKEWISSQPIDAEWQRKLDEKFRLEFNYNSNHIEGNTLTYDETKLFLLFEDTKDNHTFREYDEMRAHDVAFKIIQAWAADVERPLTERDIKNINEILLVRPFWKEAITPDGQPTRRQIKIGDYKEHPNSVRLQNGEIFHYASPAETPISMGELMEWYNTEKDLTHPIVLAAMFHYKFVRIHPFDDGNGRIARLLLNYVLLKSQYPPIIIRSDDKSNYLHALHRADIGEYNVFIDYINEQIKWSLDIALKAAKQESIEEQDDWKKKLSVLKTELHNIDAVRQDKKQTNLNELANSKIIPFAFSSLNSLEEFDDLFLTKNLMYLYSDPYNRTWINVKENQNIRTDTILFPNDDKLTLKFNFLNFNRISSKPFHASALLSLQFDALKYSLKVENDEVLTKLYHADFTENDKDLIKSKIGSAIFDQIRNKMNGDI